MPRMAIGTTETGMLNERNTDYPGMVEVGAIPVAVTILALPGYLIIRATGFVACGTVHVPVMFLQRETGEFMIESTNVSQTQRVCT